jgi:hypothetical protein
VSQDEADELANENLPLPADCEAKIEIFLKIFWLWQLGQVTLSIWLVLKTSSSNGLPQSVQVNS